MKVRILHLLLFYRAYILNFVYVNELIQYLKVGKIRKLLSMQTVSLFLSGIGLVFVLKKLQPS